MPDTNSKSKNQAMILIIANDHFYPIEDENFRKSLVSKTINENSEIVIDWVSDDIIKDVGEKNGCQKPKPIFAKDDTIGNELLFKTIIEKNTIPSKIRVIGSRVKSFMYGDQKYITDVKNSLDHVVERFCEIQNIQYWGQSYLF